MTEHFHIVAEAEISVEFRENSTASPLTKSTDREEYGQSVERWPCRYSGVGR